MSFIRITTTIYTAIAAIYSPVGWMVNIYLKYELAKKQVPHMHQRYYFYIQVALVTIQVPAYSQTVAC